MPGTNRRRAREKEGEAWWASFGIVNNAQHWRTWLPERKDSFVHEEGSLFLFLSDDRLGNVARFQFHTDVLVLPQWNKNMICSI